MDNRCFKKQISERKLTCTNEKFITLMINDILSVLGGDRYSSLYQGNANDEEIFSTEEDNIQWIKDNKTQASIAESKTVGFQNDGFVDDSGSATLAEKEPVIIRT